MKKKLLSCVLFIMMKPVFSADEFLPIKHWQTSNGANVYYVYSPYLPIVDIDILFSAGSARDGNLYGLANLTNSMIGQSARNLDADEIADQFEDVAAKFSVNVGRDSAQIHLRSLTDPALLKPAVSTLASVITQPQFGSKSFKRVKNQTLQTILMEAQSPQKIADNAFYASLYQDHPYGHSLLGTKESVNKLTPENLLAFYKKYYVGKNATITIVGALPQDKAQSLAQDILGKLPAGKKAPVLALPSDTKPVQTNIAYPASQTSIRSGQIGITMHDKDYFPLYVGNYIFGGGLLVSRLFVDVRDKRGLTYDINSYFLPMAQPGPFLVTLQTANQTRNEALSVIKQETKDYLEQGPTEEEVKLAKQSITGSFPLRFDSNSDICTQVSALGFYQMPLNFWDTYTDKIANVNGSQIQTVFKQRIQPQNWVTVMVGPDDAIKKHL